MKPELKRIEITLERISQTHPTAKADEPMQPNPNAPSFDIDPRVIAQATKPIERVPMLPKLKPLGISSHNHSVSPALALDLLRDIREIIISWQQELQQVLAQIQTVYSEGPLIDGWLESHANRDNPNFDELSVAESDSQMDYVEALTEEGISCQTPRPGYRLCGIDEQGKTWSRDCPPEDVPSVSVAIARYQKLRQLLYTKQNLETRLEGLTETLVMMRSSLM
ncbi:MAG: hypothetical protein SAJ12_17420 [Jaaginema sp. PMC 1079.18]|nr:hypothetical protein [Jaaginema sp. PMC 1080.18]MEC4852764.1 hypothetical protein [Jaaginema sp. PMC 1079.18]MEC4866826.1 hypothetical protein [Jaaginema sp. PMC 1078.18]